MPRQKSDEDEKDQALKQLIRQTVTSADATRPEDRAEPVKDRARRQARGDLDVEGYVRESDGARKKKR
jgi:hypothetical protein